MKHFDRRHFIRSAALAGLFIPSMPAILMARSLITAPITLYWGAGGSATGDGSSGSPLDCPSRAWQYAQRAYDLGGLPGLMILFQQTPGTCVIPAGMAGNLVGPLVGQVDATSAKFLGDGSNPNSYVVDARGASTVAFGATSGARFSMGGCRMLSGQANVAVDGAGSEILNSDKCVNDVHQDYCWSGTNYGRVTLIADCDIVAAAASYINVFGGDVTVPRSGRVVRVLGNSLTFTQGFVSAGDGRVVDSNTSYPQDGVTTFNTYGPRVTMSGNAYVHTGSSNPTGHFPGQNSYGVNGIISSGNGNTLL